jgi:hypothetical protein
VVITSSLVLPVPVQGIKISQGILDLDQRMPPTTQFDEFHKAEESMTERSGSRNPGKRDSQEHKAADGGKKRRFIVSRARKKRRGEKCQRRQISSQPREDVGVNMSKNSPSSRATDAVSIKRWPKYT